MDARTLLDKLFPAGHEIAFDGLFFSGTGTAPVPAAPRRSR